MIKLAILRNPFDPDQKELKQLDYIPGQSLHNYILPEVMGEDEIVICHNGQVVPEEEYRSRIPAPGDIIAVCPVVASGGDDAGKDIARVIATIAVIALAGWAGGAVAAKLYGGTWGFWSYVTAASVQLAGGYLIDTMFPQQGREEEQERRYAWGQLPPVTTEGNAIPVIFGTVRMGVMAPFQVVSQRVETDGEKQYLNMLLAAGEGPCDYDETTGEVIGISGLLINDQPIENYGSSLQIFKRAGTNDQTVIPGFDDTFEATPVGVELDLGEGGVPGEWTARQTVGNAGQGLVLTFDLPGGLYYRNDKGKTYNAYVVIEAEYRKVGDQTWTPYKRLFSFGGRRKGSIYEEPCIFEIAGKLDGIDTAAMFASGTVVTIINNDGTKVTRTVESAGGNSVKLTEAIPETAVSISVQADIVISAAETTPLRREFRIDDLPVGQYEVRCRCSAKSGTSDRYQNTVIWSTLYHVIYDDFTRPNKILLGLRALACDQLAGGMPRISALVTRSKVWVWDPEEEQYVQKDANNPAWACYDILHQARRLKNIRTGQYEFIIKGTPANRIDYYSFARWASFCEEKGLHINGVIYQTTSLWDALVAPEAAGRGKVLMRGTVFSCVCDAVEQPKYQFNVANIIRDEFRIEYAGKDDRANVLELHFYNIDKDYAEDYMVVRSDDYVEGVTIPNATQVRIPYALTWEEAYRAGKYQLRLNQYLTRSVSFLADIDAIKCRVGDVIWVQHDVPYWGEGGRIVEATATTLKLDQEVTLEAGKEYGVLVQLADDTLIEKRLPVVGETTITDEITVTEPFKINEIPQKYDKITVGPVGKVCEKFRVIYISRDNDLRRRIVALEYNEAVYEEAEDIPDIDYAPPSYVITDLKVTEHQDVQGGLWLGISWTPPRNTGYGGARVLVNGKQVGRVQSHQTTYNHPIDNIDAGVDLVITIETLNDLGLMTATASVLHTVQGAVDLPPAAPTGLAYNWDTQDLKVWWNAVVTNSNGLYTEDIKDYQIEVWVGGQKKRTEFVAGNLYTYSLPKNLQDNTTPATTVQIRVYTRDYAEQLSDVATIDCTCPLPTAPTLTAIDAVARISLSCGITNQQAQKYQKIQIKASKTAGFNPDSTGELIHDNPSPVKEHNVNTGETWYYRARIVDKLGQYSPWSPQVSATAHKVDESDMQPQILRMETTSEIEPVSGTLDNLHDGTPATGATFDQATWIEDKFVGEQIFSTFRLNVLSEVNFYLRYFNEDTQGWNNCLGSASSPKTAQPGKNVFQISPFVQARKIRVYLLGAATVYEIRFGTVGQADEFYFEKMTGDQIEAKSIKIGTHIEPAPIPLAIQPGDTLFRFDGSLLSTQGLKPLGME